MENAPVFKPMTLRQIAACYGVGEKVLRKWMAVFMPDLKRVGGSYLFTPNQVAEICKNCGEWEKV